MISCVAAPAACEPSIHEPAWTVGRPAWAVTAPSWTAHELSWTVHEAAWTVHETAWTVGAPSWPVGQPSWPVGQLSWTVHEPSWTIRRLPLAASCREPTAGVPSVFAGSLSPSFGAPACDQPGKAFLLAADKKISDPMILTQIQR